MTNAEIQERLKTLSTKIKQGHQELRKVTRQINKKAIKELRYAVYAK